MPSQNGAVGPASWYTSTLRITFSMPSPVELTQLKIQYQRKVGTPRASKRIEPGATAPAPGSTSSASTFLSVTASRLREPRVRMSAAGGTGERVAREPLTGRVRSERSQVVGQPTGRRTRG